MGVVRGFLSIGAIILDFFAVIALFLVFNDAIRASTLLAIPLILLFLVMVLVVPVAIVAFVILGPMERGRARQSLAETRGGGYVSNYPGMPMRFADYQARAEGASEAEGRRASMSASEA